MMYNDIPLRCVCLLANQNEALSPPEVQTVVISGVVGCFQNAPTVVQTHISVLPSEELDESQCSWQAVGVVSMEGERIQLNETVRNIVAI